MLDPAGHDAEEMMRSAKSSNSLGSVELKLKTVPLVESLKLRKIEYPIGYEPKSALCRSI
jgi:hypothetical protein